MKWLFYVIIYDFLTSEKAFTLRIKAANTVYCAYDNALVDSGVFFEYIATKNIKNVTERKNNLYKNR